MFQSSESGAQPPTASDVLSPRREKAHVAVYGSLVVCDGQRPAPKGHRIIKNLHILHFAEPNGWTDSLPTGRPNEWMRMLTKTLLIEYC